MARLPLIGKIVDLSRPPEQVRRLPLGEPVEYHITDLDPTKSELGIGKMTKPPLTVPIAGYWHYPQGRRRLEDLATGAPLQLVREPTNKHDGLAVQVWAADVMLGYVPKAQNVDVAWALDSGKVMMASFAGFDEIASGVPLIILRWG